MNIPRFVHGNRNADHPLGAQTQPPPAGRDIIAAEAASVGVRPAHEKLGEYVTRSPTPIAAFVPSVVEHGQQLCFHSLRHHLAVCLRNNKFINTMSGPCGPRPPFKSYYNVDEESRAIAPRVKDRSIPHASRVTFIYMEFC